MSRRAEESDLGGAECRHCPLVSQGHRTQTDTMHPQLVGNGRGAQLPWILGSSLWLTVVLRFPSMVNSVVLCMLYFTVPSGSLLAMEVGQIR